jgi:hypothetical protein
MEDEMPLFVSKWERRDGADRDALGRAALNLCRWARSQEGVRDARFYWAGTDTVAFVTTVEPGGRWGIGSGNPPTPDGSKVQFALSDLARVVANEAWADAATGEQSFRMR